MIFVHLATVTDTYTHTHRVIMGANIAGIYGAQIFRSEDSPKYRRAFYIGIGVLALGLILAIVRFVDEKFFRRVPPPAIENETGEENENENESESDKGTKIQRQDEKKVEAAF
jgi:hypothetical protein